MVFCNFCGGRQGSAAPPASGVAPILDETFSNVGEVAEDVRYAEFALGQAVRLRARVENGGPFELFLVDSEGEILQTFSGIWTEQEFQATIPEEGEYGFSFQSTGQPGNVRLTVY